MAKKKTTKKTNITINQPSVFLKILRIVLWLTPGIILGLFLPWYLYLNNLIEKKFINHESLIPSTIYSRPLALFKGQNISSKQLIYELSSLGYVRTQSPKKMAEFSYFNN